MNPNHVTQVPLPSFEIMDGAATVHQIPAARDNYIWLLQFDDGSVYCIDGPATEAPLQFAASHGLTLEGILNTHTHFDHIGVNRVLLQHDNSLDVYGAASTQEKIPGITHPLSAPTSFELKGVSVSVLPTEGHLDGHISYLIGDVLFCGDALFAGGCGRMFDGPAKKFVAGLERINSLGSDTQICCAHEYTWDNLKFAFWLSPTSKPLNRRLLDAHQIRSRGESTVPSRLSEEKRTNPFLLAFDSNYRQLVGEKRPEQGFRTDDVVHFFEDIRSCKDAAPHRAMDDSLVLEQARSNCT